MATLTVYGREYCHLCSDMVEALEALRPAYGFTLQVVDVDQDEALEQRYGTLVPVLVADGEEICHYFLDREALDAHLARRQLNVGTETSFSSAS
jgi:glutaredoxin